MSLWRVGSLAAALSWSLFGQHRSRVVDLSSG
jgi:hypothetical protein